MIAEVGAESFATVQAPNLRTRAQRHAARLARNNAPGEQPVSPLHEQLSGVSDKGSDHLSASESDGASVGAPTRARHVNDRSEPAFDMHAFAQVLSVIIQSPQARKPLDRMCVHAGDSQTYLVGVDSMS